MPANRIGVLEELFDQYNKDDFGGKLMMITLLLKRNKTKDGWYEYRAHRDWKPQRQDLHRAHIAISDYCFEENIVEGAMLHEMIHQYQCEVMDVAPDHDEFFIEWANRLGEKYGVDVA